MGIHGWRDYSYSPLIYMIWRTQGLASSRSVPSTACQHDQIRSILGHSLACSRVLVLHAACVSPRSLSCRHISSESLRVIYTPEIRATMHRFTPSELQGDAERTLLPKTLFTPVIRYITLGYSKRGQHPLPPKRDNQNGIIASALSNESLPIQK
jgi:hypothetical protein